MQNKYQQRSYFYIVLITSFIYQLLLPTANAQEISTAPTILVMGDSISAGYGMDIKLGWVNLLQNKLKQQNYAYNVINDSISGETSQGALKRLSATLAQHEPSIIIIEIGGNDGLRGMPIKLIRKNIAEMIELSQAQNTKVLLLGMQIPPNLGPRYASAFADNYASLAKQYAVAFVPFFMKGVADVPSLMLSDGIHPKAAGQTVLLDNVWPTLTALLKQAN